jgi:hypothetical protein
MRTSNRGLEDLLAAEKATRKDHFAPPADDLQLATACPGCGSPLYLHVAREVYCRAPGCTLWPALYQKPLTRRGSDHGVE